jgi:hypothetical protein
MEEMMIRFIISFCLLLSASNLLAYSGGPPDNRAGNPPGNNTCVQCHSSFDLNSGNGELNINELTGYVPGEVVTFEVSLSDEGQSRWGFELTILDDNDDMAGGLIIIDDDLTQLSDNDDLPDFVKHTRDGTFVGTNSGTWFFDWQTPSAGTGNVTIYLAGNAANNNSSTSGDYIYAITRELEEFNAVKDNNNPGIPAAFELVSPWPNPFNSSIQTVVYVPETSRISVRVINTLGQTVGVLHDGIVSPGNLLLTWQARGPSGVYLLEVKSSMGWSDTRRVIFLK